MLKDETMETEADFRDNQKGKEKKKIDRTKVWDYVLH